MSYDTAETTYTFGRYELEVRALKDLNQYWDPEGEAAAVGINDTLWPIFGVLWPSGYLLAGRLASRDLAGAHVLDIGCGIGVAAMVAAARGASVTALDVHPEAAHLLADNVARNGLPPVRFVRADWSNAPPLEGTFDLVCASDVMYERDQAEPLAAYLDALVSADGSALVIDPGRGSHNRFRRAIGERGFDEITFERVGPLDTPAGVFKGTLSEHRRGA